MHLARGTQSVTQGGRRRTGSANLLESVSRLQNVCRNCDVALTCLVSSDHLLLENGAHRFG